MEEIETCTCVLHLSWRLPPTTPAAVAALPAEFVKRIEPILRAPLPRVWDAVEGGLAEPTRATISHGHQHTVGGDVSIAGLEEARRCVCVGGCSVDVGGDGKCWHVKYSEPQGTSYLPEGLPLGDTI